MYQMGFVPAQPNGHRFSASRSQSLPTSTTSIGQVAQHGNGERFVPTDRRPPSNRRAPTCVLRFMHNTGH